MKIKFDTSVFDRWKVKLLEKKEMKMSIRLKKPAEVVKEIFPDLTDDEIKDAYQIELICRMGCIPTLTIHKYALGM